MYFKVKGAWTGGHEENLRFRAANLNHGPDTSTWYCVPESEMEKFRKLVSE